MSDTTYVKGIRLDSVTLARVEQHRQWMQDRIGVALGVTEGAALRDLILRGLASVEGEQGIATAQAPGTLEAPVQPDLAEEVLEMLTGVSYDASRYALGKLCKRGHDYEGTGQSLLHKRNRECVECHRERARKPRIARGKE